MAYIESFSVVGLAGRSGEVTRKLHRHVNIFWGLNGTGKTTLLKILHAALNNQTAGLDSLPFESASVTFKSSLDDTVFTRSYSQGDVKSEQIDESGEVFAAGDGAVESWTPEEVESKEWATSSENETADLRRVNSRFRHFYLPITRVSENGSRSPYYRENAYFPAGKPLSADEVFVRQVRASWSEYSTKSLSKIRDVQQQGLASVLAILFGGIRQEQALDLNDVEADVAYDIVRSFLREQHIPLALTKPDFAERFRASPAHQRVVVEIEEVRKDVAKILEPQREFQSVINEMYAGNKQLVLRRSSAPRLTPIAVEIGDKSIPLKSLSSGEKQLLQILLEALGAEEDTVMIDEPELSMHVDWQQRLVGSMQRVNPSCQLLLATHSPEVMADVSDEFVFEL